MEAEGGGGVEEGGGGKEEGRERGRDTERMNPSH